MKTAGAFEIPILDMEIKLHFKLPIIECITSTRMALWKVLLWLFMATDIPLPSKAGKTTDGKLDKV